MAEAAQPKLPDGLPTPTWADEEFGVALYRGDCLEILPTLPKVDAVVTDPPYGINTASNGFVNPPSAGARLWRSNNYGPQHWDRARPSAAAFVTLLGAGSVAVMFGGNYFADLLPTSKCWIAWDKCIPKGFVKPQVELAWTNATTYSRIYRVLWNGLCRDSADSYVRAGLPGRWGKRVHPAQKPITLMCYIVDDFTSAEDSILDPFMGSGTTGVACVNLGRAFVGIEIDAGYFDICVERISKAIIDRQGGPMFAEHKPRTLFTEKTRDG